jgi:NADH dehydrogenase
MRILVTGGTGVIGAGLLPQLLSGGHEVVLLTRHAERDAQEWPEGVTPFRADISDPQTITGAADGCDTVLHVSGIVSESGNQTFELVNVSGTRHLLDEANRAGVSRFVYVSSLGAERGTSAYHASKRAAEALVHSYPRSWAIVRPGGVYGPGDDVMSLLLQMHRTLPAMPVIGLGNHEFQPIFYADLGAALAVAAERRDLGGVFEMAGAELVTPAQIFERFCALTGRRPVSLPVPETLAGAVTRAAETMGLPFPLDEARFRMLVEQNVIDPPWMNALERVFGVTPTPLDEGLRYLIEAQPEQLPEQGVGRLRRKRFWADIRRSGLSADALMERVRHHITDLMTVEFDAEPDAQREIREGASLTAALPGRGHVQVRVEEVGRHHFTFATLRGHPLAGLVTFATEDRDAATVRFSITILARAATLFDWFAMNTVGERLQNQNWRAVVEGVVRLSGGDAADILHDSERLTDEAITAEFERRVREVVTGHRRRDRSTTANAPTRA